MGFRRVLRRDEESNRKGARKSTISHAKCLPTVCRANPPPSVESEQGIIKKAFEDMLYGGDHSTYVHLAVVAGGFALLI